MATFIYSMNTFYAVKFCNFNIYIFLDEHKIGFHTTTFPSARGATR